MAWVEKYRQEIADVRLIQWTTKIYEDGFSGDLSYLKGSGEPVILELCNESDDPYDPIKESRAVISVKSITDFALADLYSTEDMQFYVEIYQGESLYWCGFVDTQNYEEPYEDVPYDVSIYCTDGLSLLRNILYDDDGTYYEGRKLQSQIILDILGKIGFTEFKEFVNIYEESMDDSVDDSPMDQLKIDVDIFRDIYCDEALKEIFKLYGACIRQTDGIFQIYRPKELIGTTVYGRYFTGAAIKTSVSYTPKQYIDRSGYSSYLRQVPGGVKIIQSPASDVNIHLDCGNRESLIKNWQFRGETFDGNDFENWTQTADTNAGPISGNITEKNQGVFLDSYDTSSPYAYYTHQTFGTTLQATNDACAIEFDYLLYNNTASPVADVLTKVILRQSTAYYLSMNGNWVGSVQGLSISNTAQPGSSGWLHFKLEIQNGLLLSNTGITIELQSSNKADVRIAYGEVRFYYYSTILLRQRVNIAGRERPSTLRSSLAEKRYLKIPKEITEITYTKTNSINGKKINIDGIIGDVTPAKVNIDNIIEQFAGALVVSIRDTLAEAAADFVTDHDADYTDIDVTSDEEDIIFTGKETDEKVSGDDFTGDTSITNTSGNLDGSVVATQAYITSVPQIDTITVTGDSGEADVLCDGVTKALEWETSIALTLQNFVDDYADDYLAVGTILTCTVSTLIFTAKKAGVPFTGATSITNVSGTLDGEVEDPPTQANVVGQVRIDTITLSGYEGTADIVCDAEEQEVDIDETLSSSSDWNTRGGSESKPLLEIICDEIALQYSRPKELIDMADR